MRKNAVSGSALNQCGSETLLIEILYKEWDKIEGEGRIRSSNVKTSIVEEQMHLFFFVRFIVEERMHSFFSFFP
jgi:hypothetical protein